MSRLVRTNERGEREHLGPDGWFLAHSSIPSPSGASVRKPPHEGRSHLGGRLHDARPLSSLPVAQGAHLGSYGTADFAGLQNVDP